MSAKSIETSSEYQKLANQVGSFIEYWGFKQVHGRIWTLIFLSKEPVDANFLKETLKISKALTSMSLKDLLQYNVIHEVTKDRPGTQKYCINHNLTQVILDIIHQRELKMLSEIKQSCTQLNQLLSYTNEHPQVDLNRMNELTEMTSAAHGLLSAMTGGENVDFKVFDEVMTVTQP